MHWLASREVIGDVREMEEEGDGIDEDDRANEWGGKGGFEEMCRDDRAVRVRDKNAFAPAVISENCLDFMDHSIFL